MRGGGVISTKCIKWGVVSEQLSEFVKFFRVGAIKSRGGHGG